MGPARLDLCGSNPTTSGIAYPDALAEALVRAVSASRSYAPASLGLESARAAAARHFAASRGLESVPASEDVLLTASTSEAYGFLFKLLCDAGDEVLVPSPSYPLFEHLAELESVRLVPYRLSYDGAWHVELDSVRRGVTSRTRAIIVVSPNNPTGNYLSASEAAALGELGLPIISDEVFFEYPLDAGAPACAAGEGLRFSMGGLSKLAGSPQLKLAWTVISGADEVRREARERLELIADTYLSVGSAVQHALPQLLAASDAVTAAIRARCAQNLAQLRELLASTSVTALRVEGGWSAVLRLPRIVSEDDFVLGLLRERSVLVQPGWFYDFESEPFVVVSLLTDAARFREGIEQLAMHVAQLGG